MRVLCIDGEECLCNLIALRLARTGFSGEIKAFSDCREGMKAFIRSLLENNPFNVVIADLRMRPLNGLDIGKVVKERSPETKVIIVSEELINPKEYPFVDVFLSKPIFYGELLECLQ